MCSRLERCNSCVLLGPTRLSLEVGASSAPFSLTWLDVYEIFLGLKQVVLYGTLTLVGVNQVVYGKTY